MKRVQTASAVESAVAAWRKFHQGRSLVGVSGGRDSMALLHALSREGGESLVVCHLDHGIRGDSARVDAAFVRAWAQSRHLAVAVNTADVPALAAERKISLETAARHARQAFFFAAAQAYGCQDVLLAHHADDQVETLLFNLCRGTGARGLSGMSPVSEWTSGSERLRVFRPLLGVWRCEIDAYVAENQIPFREDNTNTDQTHTRNRVRQTLMPVLNEVFGRDVRQSIWRAAEIVAAEEAWMQAALRDGEAKVMSTERLPCVELRSRPVAEQRRLLRAWLGGRGCPQIGYHEVEAARALLDPAHGPAKINLPGDRHLRRRAGILFVEVAEQIGWSK